MSEEKNVVNENEDAGETTPEEPQVDVKAMRKRHVINQLSELVKIANNPPPQLDSEVCGFLNILFFENGNNNTMIVGEYNPVVLYGSFFEAIMSLREQEIAKKSQAEIQAAVAGLEKELKGIDKLN